VEAGCVIVPQIYGARACSSTELVFCTSETELNVVPGQNFCFFFVSAFRKLLVQYQYTTLTYLRIFSTIHKHHRPGTMRIMIGKRREIREEWIVN
jgi:hypothetical protein